MANNNSLHGTDAKNTAQNSQNSIKNSLSSGVKNSLNFVHSKFQKVLNSKNGENATNSLENAPEIVQKITELLTGFSDAKYTISLEDSE